MFTQQIILQLIGAAAGVYAAGFVAGKTAAYIRAIRSVA